MPRPWSLTSARATPASTTRGSAERATRSERSEWRAYSMTRLSFPRSLKAPYGWMMLGCGPASLRYRISRRRASPLVFFRADACFTATVAPSSHAL
eukprot:scaffold122242_cov48-Phaeocystis_antarctica.AAC.2